MAFSKAVQFRGIKNVVKAYMNKKVPRWSLFQGNQFLEKYDGDDQDEGEALLRDYLSALDQRSSDTNTYTLCVYEDPGGKIQSNTKYDASFNFRLADSIEDHIESKMSGVYENRIAGLEQKIIDLTEEPQAEEEKNPLWAALGKILEHPQVQQVLATKLLSIIDGVGDTVTGIFKKPQAAAIGNTQSQTSVQDENAKLQEAVNILVTVDTQLGTNLLKLAKVAQADPGKYKSLIGMLNLL